MIVSGPGTNRARNPPRAPIRRLCTTNVRSVSPSKIGRRARGNSIAAPMKCGMDDRAEGSGDELSSCLVMEASAASALRRGTRARARHRCFHCSKQTMISTIAEKCPEAQQGPFSTSHQQIWYAPGRRGKISSGGTSSSSERPRTSRVPGWSPAARAGSVIQGEEQQAINGTHKISAVISWNAEHSTSARNVPSRTHNAYRRSSIASKDVM